MVVLALLLPVAMAMALPGSVAVAIPYYFAKGLRYGEPESMVALMLGIACIAFTILAWKSRSYVLSILLLTISFLSTLVPFIAIAWVAPAWA